VIALYEPILDCVVMSNAVHVYVSQADKGELVMGPGSTRTTVRAARLVPRDRAPDGGRARALPDLRARSLLRTWAGIVDVCPDASPIIGPTPIDGLFSTAAGGPAASRATPGSGWAFAELIATGLASWRARTGSSGSRQGR
jgi:sarcosine oxidase subunit beta